MQIGDDAAGKARAQPVLDAREVVRRLVRGDDDLLAGVDQRIEGPRVDLALDVQARPIQEGQNVFEVSLMIRADAKVGETPCLIAELTYCGIFTITVPQEHLEPVLLVECPRLLFPFARNILADVTREGGFPPVMLNPIDFVQLWQNRRDQPSGNA